MAKNDFHFAHCSVNEPIRHIVIWRVYLVHQALLWTVEQWGRASIFSTSCVALAGSYYAGEITFSVRNGKGLSSSTF